jgi:hypothetical protein
LAAAERVNRRRVIVLVETNRPRLKLCTWDEVLGAARKVAAQQSA